MNATGGTGFAASEGRGPVAVPAAGVAGVPAVGLARRGGGTILDAIGDTPLVQVEGIWVKLEYLNPSGSIKARIAKYMIERAEREGLLVPGDTIVEASSGNTGNAMSLVTSRRSNSIRSGTLRRTGPGLAPRRSPSCPKAWCRTPWSAGSAPGAL